MTALSYSCTTLKQTQREKGIVTRTRAHEIIVRSSPQSPTPLSDSSAVTRNRTTQLLSLVSYAPLSDNNVTKNPKLFPLDSADELLMRVPQRRRIRCDIQTAADQAHFPSPFCFFPLLSVLLLSMLLGKKEPVGKNQRIQPEGFSTVS